MAALINLAPQNFDERLSFLFKREGLSWWIGPVGKQEVTESFKVKTAECSSEAKDEYPS